MKLRADFVTNSSSSSYVAMNIHTHDGRNFDISGMQEDATWNEDNFPQKQDSALVYTYYPTADDDEAEEPVSVPINTVTELAATLFFNDSYIAVDYSVILPIFTYLIKITSAADLVESLKSANGFEELENVDLSPERSEEEIYQEICPILSEALGDYECYFDVDDQEKINAYKELVENVSELSEIECLEVSCGEVNWDEFTNIYVDRLNEYLTEHPFSAVEQDSPEYEEALQFWCDLIETKVLYDVDTFESIQSLVEAALESGRAWDMIPRSVESERTFTYYI